MIKYIIKLFYNFFYQGKGDHSVSNQRQWFSYKFGVPTSFRVGWGYVPKGV